jgi:hypothetical protein
MVEQVEEWKPTARELEHVVPLSQVRKITSLGRDTTIRVYPHLIVRLSPRRLGMKLKHALAIACGEAPPAPPVAKTSRASTRTKVARGATLPGSRTVSP